MKENKEILTMNAQELQAEVAVATGLSKTKMAEVMKAVNESVTTALKQAKEGTDVLVKLFPGVTITAEFVDKHEVRRPVDGAMVMKDAEIKVRAKATSPIKNAVNA
ncbi:MAG: HU family DNA-binding protein [Clostridiales bacterium]|nr:HU family DNA-binding protein [Clostridiales bacterium]